MVDPLPFPPPIFSPRAQPTNLSPQLTVSLLPSYPAHLPPPLTQQPYPYVRRDLYPFVCIVERGDIHFSLRTLFKNTILNI
jgi:hypothetical protein